MNATGDRARATSAWLVVTQREVRELWLGGRGLPIMVAYASVLSVSSYLAASNRALNFLERREAVNVTLQVAVAVGALLALAAAADAISGERDRGTLESLLLTPAPRSALVLGKALAAFSVWLAAYVVSVPYLWYLGRGTQVTLPALIGGGAVGLLLGLFVVGFGLLASASASSSRVSLATSFFVLLAVYAPTQMATGARQSWIGNVLTRLDPFTAALHYLSGLVVNGNRAGDDAAWLLSPALLGALAFGAALATSRRLTLHPGGGS